MAPPTTIEMRERLRRQDLRVHELEWANLRLEEETRAQKRLSSALLSGLKDLEEWARIVAIDESGTYTALVARMDDLLRHAQDAGVTPQHKMDNTDNASLCYLAKFWKLDGDWMTCKGCDRSLIASRDGEEIHHKDGCKFSDQQHPWRRLRNIIAPFAAKVGE